MTGNDSTQIDLKQWVLKTVYGWLIGFACVVILAVAAETLGLGNTQFFIGTGMGAGVGFMQSHLLRRKFGWNWNWMWASIIGMTIAFVIFDFGSSVWSAIPAYSLPLSIVLGGLIVGILQFRVLKSESINSAHQWVLICFAGWSSVAVMIGLSDYLNTVLPKGPISVIPFLLLVVLLSSPLLGWITGLGLKKLIYRSSI